MTIDLIVRETLERELADVRVPRADLAGSVAPGAAAAGPGCSVAWPPCSPWSARRRRWCSATRAEPSPTATTVDVPAMDFGSGLRGVCTTPDGD